MLNTSKFFRYLSDIFQISFIGEPHFSQVFLEIPPFFPISPPVSLPRCCARNLGSAVDHASGALAADAGGASAVKALYRRGLARRRLAEHRNEQQNLQLAQDVAGGWGGEWWGSWWI